MSVGNCAHGFGFFNLQLHNPINISILNWFQVTLIMMTMNMFTWTRKKLPKEHFYLEPVSSRVSSLLVSLIALIMELLLARKDKRNLQQYWCYLLLQSEIWISIYYLLLYLEKINVFLCYESINLFNSGFGVSYTIATMKTHCIKVWLAIQSAI